MGFNPANPVYGGGYEVKLPDGSRYVIDGATGLLTASYDANGNEIRYVDGVVEEVPGGPMVQRDSAGRIKSISDGRGRTVSYSYHPAAIWRPSRTRWAR